MNANSYNLNQGQKKAAEAFFEYLFDTENSGFIISGPAGTGKTYWMGYIIDIVMPQYHKTCKMLNIPPDYTGVVMTATNNKAAEVLEEATGRTTQTIHSFLNLTVYEDFSTGKNKLSRKPQTWVVHEKMIIFIDECSMIDKELFSYIMEGTHKCKIIYVGDRSQLAPITEKLSPIYLQNYKFFELTEQMRTSVPELQALNAQLRETVETGVFKPIHEVPGIIDYLDDYDMQKRLNATFSNQTKESRVLAYTNKRVVEFNDYIRQKRNLLDSFQNGEILINNSAVKIGKNIISAESEIEIIQNHGSSTIEIVKGTMMKIDHVHLRTHLGVTLGNVPIPTDRAHYNELIKYFKRQKNWERHYYLKQSFPDLRPRDATTVHKSQGSTYESVFIDLGNISTCHQADQVARMLYVAFSRARTKVYVYGDLAEKYGGFIRA